MEVTTELCPDPWGVFLVRGYSSTKCVSNAVPGQPDDRARWTRGGTYRWGLPVRPDAIGSDASAGDSAHAAVPLDSLAHLVGAFQPPENLDQLCMVRFWWLESAVLRLVCSDSGVNQGVWEAAWPAFRWCGQPHACGHGSVPSAEDVSYGFRGLAGSVVGEVNVLEGGGRLVVSEQTADRGNRLAREHRHTGVAVAQVMNSHVCKVGPSADNRVFARWLPTHNWKPSQRCQIQEDGSQTIHEEVLMPNCTVTPD